MRALVLALLVGCLALLVGCAGAQAPRETLEGAYWCYGATFGDQDVFTCAEDQATCEGLRARDAATADAASETCTQIDAVLGKK